MVPKSVEMIKTTLMVVFLFASTISPLSAQQTLLETKSATKMSKKSNLVLLPVLVSDGNEDKADILGRSIQTKLQEKYNVFFGDQVQSALEEEYKKEDCSAEACVQNVAILFNGELVADAKLDTFGDDSVFSIRVVNIITGQLVASAVETCFACNPVELISFVGTKTAGLSFASDRPLFDIIQKNERAQEDEDKDKEQEQDQAALVVRKKPENEVNLDQDKSKSSWSRYGLGGLALAALGGGGSGGGSSGGGSSGGGSSGGGSSGGGSSGSDDSGSATIDGFAVKGPLSGATVFLDLNDNGVLDAGEPNTTSGSNGGYTLSVTGSDVGSAPIVVITNSNTVDTSSGEVADGLILKAPRGSSIVSPLTTMMEDGGLTETQIKQVLGINANVDLTDFNPFSDAANATLALQVEKAALKVMTSINSVIAVGSGGNMTVADASARAFIALSESLEDKFENNQTFDFNSSSDLAVFEQNARTELLAAGLSASDANKLSGTLYEARGAFQKIEGISDLYNQNTRGILREIGNFRDDLDGDIDEDFDGDGITDFADAFPYDARETLDSDGDGIGDNRDAFPNNAADWADHDGDGLGNNNDADWNGYATSFGSSFSEYRYQDSSMTGDDEIRVSGVRSGNMSIPLSSGNRHFDGFLAWYSDGNDPLPPEGVRLSYDPMIKGAEWNNGEEGDLPDMPSHGYGIDASGIFVANDFIGNSDGWHDGNFGKAGSVSFNRNSNSNTPNVSFDMAYWQGRLDENYMIDNAEAHSVSIRTVRQGTYHRKVWSFVKTDSLNTGVEVEPELLVHKEGSFKHVNGYVVRDYTRTNDPYAAYGVIGFTDQRFIPTHGSATYVGDYFGSAGSMSEVKDAIDDDLFGSDNARNYFVDGTITLNLEFGSASAMGRRGQVTNVTGSMSGGIRGSFSQAGSEPTGEKDFWARLDDPIVNDVQLTGNIFIIGKVFGPRAPEVGGVFSGDLSSSTEVGGFFRASRSGQACSGRWCY